MGSKQAKRGAASRGDTCSGLRSQRWIPAGLGSSWTRLSRRLATGGGAACSQDPLSLPGPLLRVHPCPQSPGRGLRTGAKARSLSLVPRTNPRDGLLFLALRTFFYSPPRERRRHLTPPVPPRALGTGFRRRVTLEVRLCPGSGPIRWKTGVSSVLRVGVTGLPQAKAGFTRWKGGLETRGQLDSGPRMTRPGPLSSPRPQRWVSSPDASFLQGPPPLSRQTRAPGREGGSRPRAPRGGEGSDSPGRPRPRSASSTCPRSARASAAPKRPRRPTAERGAPSRRPGRKRSRLT